MRWDHIVEDDDERASGSKCVVSKYLCVCERDRVVDVLDGFPASDLLNLIDDRRRGQRAIEHVCCAKGLEERFIAERRGGDYGRVPRELRDLNGWGEK